MELESELLVALISLFIALIMICTVLVDTIKAEIGNVKTLNPTSVKQNFPSKNS